MISCGDSLVNKLSRISITCDGFISLRHFLCVHFFALSSPQGMHGIDERTIVTSSPIGVHISGSVGPKITIVGFLRAAAKWDIPESAPMNTSLILLSLIHI